jgi:hypothetical protein
MSGTLVNTLMITFSVCLAAVNGVAGQRANIGVSTRKDGGVPLSGSGTGSGC